MIRLVQKRLIIPRGDTGILSLPAINAAGKDNCAVFTIIDPQTNTLVTEKRIDNVTDTIEIVLTHEDTVNLPVGRFLWDIKFYNNPVFEDGKLVSGEEIDSYYAAYKMPECEIRQTGDKLLTAENAASTTLTPYYINLVESSLSDITQIMRDTISKAEEIQNLKVELTMLEHGAAAILEYDSETNTLHLSLPAVEDGVTPNLTIGTVQEGAIAAATITGTKENPILNLTLPNANVPTKVSELENDSGYLTTETDPTVPQWAKAVTKPSYTPQEVGALPADTYIPQKTSDLTNDAGYLTTETDPTVPAWAKEPNKPVYTAAEVGAPTEQEVNSMIATAIGQINSFDMAVVQTLPTQNINTHTIYLVPKTGETNDVYDEYVCINNSWEMVGNTQIDLSDYALKSELPTKVSDLTDDSGHYIKPANGIPASDLADGVIPDAPVQDVQVNGTSVVTDGVANVPVASPNTLGVLGYAEAYGVTKNNSNQLRIVKAISSRIAAGTNDYYPIVPSNQHESTFYGLSKVAGVDLANETVTLGTYPETSKTAIKEMLGVQDGLKVVRLI